MITKMPKMHPGKRFEFLCFDALFRMVMSFLFNQHTPDFHAIFVGENSITAFENTFNMVSLHDLETHLAHYDLENIASFTRCKSMKLYLFIPQIPQQYLVVE